MAYGNGWTERKPINWGKVSTEGPKPLSPGVYKITIAEAEGRRNAENTKTLIRMVLDVTEDHEGNEVKKRIYDNGIVLDEEGGFKAKQLCEILEIDPPETNGAEDADEFAEALLGSELWAQIGLGKPNPNGRIYNDIMRYLAEDDVEEAAESMAKLISGDKPAAKAKAKTNGRGKAKTNGHAVAEAAPRRRGRPPEPEETEDLLDEEEDEEEAPPPPARRGRGRPRKDAQA